MWRVSEILLVVIKIKTYKIFKTQKALLSHFSTKFLKTVPANSESVFELY